MSLISDTDFLIHSLRLNYLRNVEDPYGPRLISLNPTYNSNPYIVAATLADTDRWPELTVPSSPVASEDDVNRSAPYPGGAALKHTHTIMGPSRTGMYGMRVSGRRASTAKQSLRSDAKAVKVPVDSSLSRDPEVPVAGPSRQPASHGEEHPASLNEVNSRPIPLEDASLEVPAPPQDNGSAERPPAFVPKFKGAAEMEARRKLRLQARLPPFITTTRPTQTDISLNPELSSSDSEGGMIAGEEEDDEDDDEYDDDDDDVPDAEDGMDGDDFDPEFAATRTPGVASDSATDLVYVLSSTDSALSAASLHNNSVSHRPRLSPVSEGGVDEHKSEGATGPKPRRTQSDFGFEMVTVPSKNGQDMSVNPQIHANASNKHRPPNATAATSSSSTISFARTTVAPARSAKSALTALLAASSINSSNPFSELYAAISGRAEQDSMSVQIFFPHARDPSGTPMDLKVRKDATVEEVIGFALWNYCETGWSPKLDEGLGSEDDPQRSVRLSAVGWILRIAEEDGEVDEDFPPPDRTSKISKFNFDAYAILEASPAQVQQNKVLEGKLQRRPSRVMTAKRKPEQPISGLAPPAMTGTSAVFGSTLGTSSGLLSSSLGPSSSHGPQIFLRIRIAEVVDAVHFSTTVQASSGMYMQEVLDLVCRKRKLASAKEYALVLGEQNILIPLDRTVASLQGKTDLVLAKRSTLHEMGVRVDKQPGRTTDPNASIFKRQSEIPDAQYSLAMDYMAAYKKYIIHRKLPMLVGRQERVLAIDGGYIHIMPSSNKAKALFESGSTASYHIDSVITCKQSAKSSSTFKFVVFQDGRVKRYDFEAENSKLATEIVRTVREMKMKAALERSGTVKQSRRSRQVV